MRTHWVASLFYNLQRATGTGLVVGPLFFFLLLGSDNPDLGLALEAGIAGLFAGYLMLPFGVVAALILRVFDAFIVRATVGWLYLTALIYLMLGDPFVVILSKIRPDWVPVDQPKLWNPHILMRVDKTDAEESAPAVPQRSSQHPAVVHAEKREWREDVAAVEDDQARHALELANVYLDDVTGLVHPPQDVDAAKAREIERLLGLTRKQLAKARSAPEARDYITMLEAQTEQYEGIAVAFGKGKLAQGARLVESALSKLEDLGRAQGIPNPSSKSLFLLCWIYLAMGKKRLARSFIDRAVIAEPENIDYRRMQDELASA